MGGAGLLTSATLLAGYFGQLDRFVLPVNDYHAFYLFWWFAWSIMIGQFVSRFVSGISTWQLLVLLLVVPLYPHRLVVLGVVLVFLQRDFDSGPDELGDDGHRHFVCGEFS